MFDQFWPPLTDRGATHIVKSFDPRLFPELAANEYFCLRASALAGLPTAKAVLSENRSLLVVERFDLAPDGTYYGMEDFCVLSGMKASRRYQSSYEKLAERVSTYVTDEHHSEAREQLFAMVVLSCAVGNGDAHLKNFALLYDAPGVNVRMAPVYDMVSTVQYLPRDAMALTLNGAKDFPSASALVQFGRTACGLSRKKVTNITDQIIDGVNRAQLEIKLYAKEQTDFKTAAKHLLRTFSAGVARLQ